MSLLRDVGVVTNRNYTNPLLQCITSPISFKPFLCLLFRVKLKWTRRTAIIHDWSKPSKPGFPR